MAKRGEQRRVRDKHLTSFDQQETPPKPRNRAKTPLAPQTDAQRRYISSINHNIITFGIGPAGVGKTYVAARLAAAKLKSGEIEKVILTRPAVEVGRSIGHLPGEMDEKMAPFIAAYGPGFRDELGDGHFEYLARVGRIETVPVGFIQGRSFDDAMVLLDEAQNLTPLEIKMCLTRIGEGTRMVIDGDPRQQATRGKSGLIDALEKTSYIKSVGVVEFEVSDVVRSGIVREILIAYDATASLSDNDEGNVLELPSFISGNSAA